jgi:hypothetical protein
MGDKIRPLNGRAHLKFFIREVSVTMRLFVQPQATMKARIIAQQKCLYVIDVGIIGSSSRDSLFAINAKSTDDNIERTKTNAMKAFVLNEVDQIYIASANMR